MGKLEAPGFHYITVGTSVNEVEESLRELVADFLANEGSTQLAWIGVRVDDLIFESQGINKGH